LHQTIEPGEALVEGDVFLRLGGDYIGQILGGITFATQPQSQTLSAVTTLSFSNVITPTVANSGLLHDTAAYGNHIFATTSRSGGGTEGNPYFGIVDIVKSANNGSSFTHELEVSKFQSESDPVPVVPTTKLSFPSNGSRVVFTDGRGNLRYFDGGGSIATSTGPITPLGESSVGVAYLASAGRFVSIANTRIASSSDGVSWTQRLSYNASRNQFIFAIADRYVVLPNLSYLNGDAYSSSGVVTNPAIHHSTDGVTWTTVVKSYGYKSAARNGSRRVAARAGNTSSVDYSTDGLTWTTVSLPVAVQTVSHVAGMFWAFSGGTDVLTSPDGVTWTLREVPGVGASQAAMAEGSNVAFFLGTGFSSNAFQATTSTAAASANLTVSATSDGGAAVSYQWQSSLDAGTTWANVTNATTSTLSLTGLTAADNGTRYRVLASATGASTITSQSAILTVTG
jgi:hypothetical protein